MADLPTALFRRWIHVHELDTTDVYVYRPADRPVPPARGRDGIEFRSDGTYVSWKPGPTDAPVASEPRAWTSDSPDRIRVYGPSAREALASYQIDEVDDEVLRLRPEDAP
ncbi:hypothetical protein [Phytoactinopolyspora endophytica]|uniref:hypothetical protein n=1 Tax=Phytoactinopolyspora endophytica TaxID=1642495 RepID=UPI00101BABB8|nr:hypothetical protein [Phytoactinopolyspora endophytica]